jgi:hypothetical protein
MEKMLVRVKVGLPMSLVAESSAYDETIRRSLMEVGFSEEAIKIFALSIAHTKKIHLDVGILNFSKLSTTDQYEEIITSAMQDIGFARNAVTIRFS